LPIANPESLLFGKDLEECVRSIAAPTLVLRRESIGDRLGTGGSTAQTCF